MSDKYIEKAKQIILQNIDCNEINVFLFGSRAFQNFRRDSDIDVGFLGRRQIKHRIFRKISEGLEESRVPYHFDLIDFSKVDEDFKKVALIKIVIWNKAKNFDIN